jgi:hypothetical protein
MDLMTEHWGHLLEAAPAPGTQVTNGDEADGGDLGGDEGEVEGEGEAAPVVEPEPRDTLDASRALLMAERESILNPGVHLSVISLSDWVRGYIININKALSGQPMFSIDFVWGIWVWVFDGLWDDSPKGLQSICQTLNHKETVGEHEEGPGDASDNSPSRSACSLFRTEPKSWVLRQK